MCECGLPAKVLAVYPEFAHRHTPYRHFLGCRKKTGRCRMTMWCKLGERGKSEEEEGVEVYDELVLKNMDLEADIN
ncbi:hypothetical protein LINPERHAP2_LOCUS19892, partial [Linum perenne]